MQEGKKMKKMIGVIILCVAFAVSYAATDIFVDTTRVRWTSAGTITASAAAADSALGVTERLWTSASILNNSVAYLSRTGTNFVSIRFSLATNNHDVDIDIYAKAFGDNNLQRICTLDVINGTQTVSGSATLEYADTINISNEAWLGDVWTVVPGAEHMAVLNLDLAGYDGLLFHGYGTFDGDATIEVRNF
jgi:hypothetical protein